jgi:hypothetical protein
VFGNTVDDIAFGPWTWVMTGQSFPDAAAVDYTSKVGTVAAAEEITSMMHLVEADGQWRWFFGTSREALDTLPSDCELGGAG